MSLKIICLFCAFSIWNAVSSEDSFCGNKCFGEGVVTSRSCYCDSSCSIYNDCCADSKFFEINSTKSGKNIICKRKALVVNSCVKEWNGPDFMIKSCKNNPDDDVDPVGNTPVTSEVTGITYSNYFCAICNGDAKKIIMWNVKMSCPLLNADIPVDKDEVFKYIFYNHPTKEWGYVLRDDTTKKMSFHGCAVTSEIPDIHKIKVRQCASDEVKTCASTWKKDLINEMCHRGYTDPVYSNGTKYKNFYCAICNRIDHSAISCGQAIGPRTNKNQEPDDKNSLSFSLLLDINFSEGNLVGKRLAEITCLKGEIFDPFARRCRNIVCGIPGYVLQNGMCVADSVPPL
ncbi:SMB domain-containing protein [Trichonephila inaurata madagascariensis]|uniref:SMB domain-containing protein n=1 Tax=Trichonephila inaurata madagascariensis TaxID=2747483 RepID=A0A8X6WMY4_9ARAC|nr:SMB domain-containing protein [Trichonephila inaurata madagascariensis]